MRFLRFTTSHNDIWDVDSAPDPDNFHIVGTKNEEEVYYSIALEPSVFISGECCYEATIENLATVVTSYRMPWVN